MEDPCQGKTLLKSVETMQPMHDGEALHHHQTRTGNIKQMKQTNFYRPEPMKVHSKIWLTNCISFSQHAHAGT